MNESLRYTIIKPTKQRDRYAIACFVLEGRKKAYQELPEKIRNLSNKINEQYQDKLISNLEAETLLKDLILNEYKKLNVRNQVLKNSVISEVNQKTFNKFWDKVYSVRFLSDEKSPKHDILKALKLIEPLSIQTATVSQLQNKLRDSGVSNAEIRRASDRLNQLLKFLGRDFKLNKPKATYKKVQYVTFEEFNKIHSHLSDSETKDFALTLFSTGLRFSEALALTKDDLLDKSTLNIDKQVTPIGEIKLPKRDKVGKVVILPFGQEAVKRFVANKNKERFRFNFYNALIEAGRKAFPDEKAKWVGPHDLRHSHAIYLLSKGANLTQVALNLRNRIDVCQMYYTGFEHSDATLEGLKRLVK